ncbi:hypothetical protein O988_03907 [Pseudogymnoascus sp. VKM F-3808]|nr:hypothetical protein O988_03907 [Pseudogymnoascus sp. VKM F-3808]
MSTFKEKMVEMRASLAAQPNSREHNRETTRFLRDLRTPKWGYAIYRTVYTAESDTLFPLALAKLDGYVHCEIDWDLYDDPTYDPAPNRDIRERYENVILEDRERYDGASMNSIREYFKQWVEEQGKDVGDSPRFQICLVFDEVAVRALSDAPDPLPSSDAPPSVLIRVVDGKFVATHCEDPSYAGWIKVSPNALMGLYGRVDQSELLLTVYVLMERDSESFLFTG